MGAYDGSQRDERVAPLRSIPNPALALDFDVVFGRENLFRVFRHLKSAGRRAPGGDRIALADISIPEGAENCGRLAQRIHDAEYVPGRSHNCLIPRGDGRARTLAIPTSMDCVVARAMHEALSPHAEQIFDPRSFGFRPKRTAYQMLARVAGRIGGSDALFVGAFDATAAYDNILLEPVREAFNTLFDEPIVKQMYRQERWNALLRVIISAGNNSGRGLQTGNPLSPLALNLALHYRLDTKLKELDAASWSRWADNLIVVASDIESVEYIRKFAERQLSPLGLPLHGSIADLSAGECAEVLGFLVGRSSGRVTFVIHEKSWARLGAELKQLHDVADPPGRLEQILRGWIDAYGPALVPPDSIIERLADVALQETQMIPNKSLLLIQAKLSRRRWERLFRRAGGKLTRAEDR